MQRRQRHVPVQRRQNLCVDAHRLGVLQPPVHDAVADASQGLSAAPSAQKLDQVVERSVMTEPLALAPALLADNSAVGALGDEAGRSEEPLDLPAHL